MTNLQEISLYEILEAIANEYASQNRAVGFSEDDKFLTVNQAQAAIAELVDKCIGPDEYNLEVTEEYVKDYQAIRNQLRAEIRNNLIKAGVLNG